MRLSVDELSAGPRTYRIRDEAGELDFLVVDMSAGSRSRSELGAILGAALRTPPLDPQAPPAPPIQAVSAPKPSPVEQLTTPTSEVLVTDDIRAMLVAIRKGEVELPLAAPILTELVKMKADPDLGAKQVRTIVMRSPALSAAVLRAANSAYYGSAKRTTALPDAIGRLGNSTVLSLAMTSLHRNLHKAEPGPAADLLTQMWDHTLLTATVARELGRAVKLDPEALYLCALLRDVGEVILVRFLAEAWPGGPIGPRQMSEFGDLIDSHHQAIGRTLLTLWQLPRYVIRVAASHHPTDAAAVEKLSAPDRVVLDTLTVAAHEAGKHAPACSVSSSNVIEPVEAADRLGLDEETMAGAVTRALSWRAG